MMRKSVVGLIVFLLATPVLADKKLDDRMMHSASILQEIRGALDEDAPGILNDAYAVAVFPVFIKVGLFGGVKHGRGVLATRLASGDWSKPAFVRLTSGSFGLQFGVSMSQLLIVFKDPKAVDAISGGQFSVGADAGYAAGELGGSAGASTDNKLENQIVAMARSKGLFAGVALEGGVLRIEKDSNVEFYNDAIGLDGRTLLEDTEVELPTIAQHFLIVLDESVPPLSTEATPLSKIRDTDNLRFAADEERRQVAESAPLDPSSPKASGASQTNSSATDSTIDLTQPPSRAIASAPGAVSSGNAATQGSWVTPDGLELPSADTGRTATGQMAGAADRLSTGNAPVAATWVTPQGEDLPPSETESERGQSSRPGLASRITGKLADAALDVATELAIDSIRNRPETQGAKLAASVGGELASSAVSGKKAPAPPPKRPDRPAISAANNGEWVEPLESDYQLASRSPDSLPAVANAPGSDYQLASRLPDSLPAAANAPVSDITGPPAPSDWPEEWRLTERLGGICEPGS